MNHSRVPAGGSTVKGMDMTVDEIIQTDDPAVRAALARDALASLDPLVKTLTDIRTVAGAQMLAQGATDGQVAEACGITRTRVGQKYGRAAERKAVTA